ncbi:MAG: DinB family protein [Flavobacteriales bacterium]|nr:DinB family protein [Flavobacteriales bacterium]
MAKHNSNEILDQLINDVERIVDAVNAEFVPLDNDKLYQQPTIGKWSINQCLQHLNSTGYHYLPQIKVAIEGAVCRCQKHKEYYRSGWIGEIAVSGTRPLPNGSIPKPMKTFKKEFDPLKSEYTAISAIPEFLEQQKQLLHYLQQARQVNLGRNKITSLIPILRFRLGDAFRFLIAHEERHIQQAKNVGKAIGV